jgi:hypothetical protein
MMKKVEETSDNIRIKKKWLPPMFEIIPFKNTGGGGPASPPEDQSFNPTAS